MHRLILVTISLLILSCLSLPSNGGADDTLTVQTDRTVYSIGDTVLIEVQFKSDPLDPTMPGMQLNIVLEINTPTGGPIERTLSFLTNAEGDAFGTYSLSLDPDASPGIYTLTANLYGNHLQSNVVTFTVEAAFDFTIGLSPLSQTVEQGGTVNYQVFITYSDPSHMGTVITYQVAGLGPGMTWIPTGGGIISISTSPTTPPGTYPITVVGSALGVTHQTSATLIVTPKTSTTTVTTTAATSSPSPTQTPVTGDFSIQASPLDLSILQGESATFSLTVDKTGEFNDPVTFTGVNGHPSASTFDLRPEEGFPTFNAILRIDTPESTQPGNYMITVEASGGGKTHSATVTLTVKEKPIETETPVSTTTEATETESSISTLFSNPMYLMIIVVAGIGIGVIATLARRVRAPTPRPAHPQPTAPIRYCANCGDELKPGATFCPSCGERIE